MTLQTVTGKNANGENVTAKVEADCTIALEGKTFESGGAAVTPEYAIGYMSNDMKTVTTWHGEHLGNARVTASWRTPRSYVSDRCYQVEAVIDGRKYTGRTGGEGMIWKGKAKAK